MQYNNICFHNVEELVEIEGKEGLRIQRVPETVREQLNEGAQAMMLSPTANVELRFILESDSIEVTLSTQGEKKLRMTVMWGQYQELGHYDIGGDPTTVRLEINEFYRQLKVDSNDATSYNPRMVRLMFGGSHESHLFFHDIGEGTIRLPDMSDSPKKRLLSYGTSITHGFGLSGPHMTYPFLIARKLGMDVINLGSAGSAFCEEGLADYIAKRNDWDIATLSISVNMYLYFDISAFTKKIDYMIKTIAHANPRKPIYCITLFPFFDDVGIYHELSPKSPEAYRQALRDVVMNCEMDNVSLIEGPSLLTDFNLLAPDLIHPNDVGMMQIAENLSKRLDV